MKVRVKLFAALREVLGTGELEHELPPNATVSVLLDSLMRQHPVLMPYAHVIRVAVNRAYADAETLLHEGDEVACLPPVGGG